MLYCSIRIQDELSEGESIEATFEFIIGHPEESRFCHKVAIFGRMRGMIDFGKPMDLLSNLPGRGRKIELFFNNVNENAIERLESIEGLEKALETKVGIEFSLLSDLDLKTLSEKITIEFPNAIHGLKQSDSQMEDLFRYKAMEVPKIE